MSSVPSLSQRPCQTIPFLNFLGSILKIITFLAPPTPIKSCSLTSHLKMLRNLVLIPSLNLFLASLYPWLLVPSLSFCLNSSSLFLFFTPIMYLYSSAIVFFSPHFVRISKPRSFNLLWWPRVSIPLIIVVSPSLHMSPFEFIFLQRGSLESYTGFQKPHLYLVWQH